MASYRALWPAGPVEVGPLRSAHPSLMVRPPWFDGEAEADTGQQVPAEHGDLRIAGGLADAPMERAVGGLFLAGCPGGQVGASASRMGSRSSDRRRRAAVAATMPSTSPRRSKSCSSCSQRGSSVGRTAAAEDSLQLSRTKAPPLRPRRIPMTPTAWRRPIASRTVGRLTRSSGVSSRSTGNRSRGRTEPSGARAR